MGMGADFDISLVVLQLEKMMAGGIPTLDENAKIPKNQIDLIASDVGAIADDGDAVLSSLNTATGTISSSILPSYVDDVLNFANLAAFPVAGESGKIYVTENDNKTYRWTGTVYVEISSSLIPSWSDITGKPSPIEYLSSNPNPPNYNYWLFGNFYGQYWEIIPVSQSPGNNTVVLRTITGGVNGTTLSATATTPSTSPTTGASVIAGGQGVVGDQWIGGNINGLKIGFGGGSVNTNTVVGASALLSNTNGYLNSAFGCAALQANTTGINNSSFGAGALFYNTTGGSNSAFGAYALRSNTTGTYNSAFGSEAGRYQVNGSSLLSVSNNSCFIGSLTKGTQDAINENVFGYNVIGNGSNTVTIGNSNIIRTYLKGVVDIANTTPSTSPTTGASVVGGGQGIMGSLFVGGSINTESSIKVSNNSGGYVSLQSGGTNSSGFVEIFKSTGVRIGYIGFNDSNLGYVCDAGFNHVFSGGYVSASSFYQGTTQVLTSRRTGWGVPTGTATRTTFATSTVTLPQLAERLKALIDDLTTHGLIGA